MIYFENSRLSPDACAVVELRGRGCGSTAGRPWSYGVSLGGRDSWGVHGLEAGGAALGGEAEQGLGVGSTAWGPETLGVRSQVWPGAVTTCQGLLPRSLTGNHLAAPQGCPTVKGPGPGLSKPLNPGVRERHHAPVGPSCVSRTPWSGVGVTAGEQRPVLEPRRRPVGCDARWWPCRQAHPPALSQTLPHLGPRHPPGIRLELPSAEPYLRNFCF